MHSEGALKWQLTKNQNTVETARQRTSEMWGCLLTILTVGLWIPIWILMSIFGTASGYRCQMCGKKN